MNYCLNIVYFDNKQIQMQILNFRVVKHCTKWVIELNFVMGLAIATSLTGHSNEPSLVMTTSLLRELLIKLQYSFHGK